MKEVRSETKVGKPEFTFIHRGFHLRSQAGIQLCRINCHKNKQAWERDRCIVFFGEIVIRQYSRIAQLAPRFTNREN